MPRGHRESSEDSEPKPFNTTSLQWRLFYTRSTRGGLWTIRIITAVAESTLSSGRLIMLVAARRQGGIRAHCSLPCNARPGHRQISKRSASPATMAEVWRQHEAMSFYVISIPDNRYIVGLIACIINVFPIHIVSCIFPPNNTSRYLYYRTNYQQHNVC